MPVSTSEATTQASRSEPRRPPTPVSRRPHPPPSAGPPRWMPFPWAARPRSEGTVVLRTRRRQRDPRRVGGYRESALPGARGGLAVTDAAPSGHRAAQSSVHRRPRIGLADRPRGRDGTPLRARADSPPSVPGAGRRSGSRTVPIIAAWSPSITGRPTRSSTMVRAMPLLRCEKRRTA
jgi:hypothetical protein